MSLPSHGEQQRKVGGPPAERESRMRNREEKKETVTQPGCGAARAGPTPAQAKAQLFSSMMGPFNVVTSEEDGQECTIMNTELQCQHLVFCQVCDWLGYFHGVQ